MKEAKRKECDEGNLLRKEKEKDRIGKIERDG